jgi:hypothetical protein
VPEVGIDRDLIAGAQQPGAVTTHRWGPHPLTEDDLHLLGPAGVKIVDAQRLKERPGVPRRVEYDGAGDLDLTHGDVPPVARSPVGLGQR